MYWFDEKIEYIKNDRFLYKVICFILGGPRKRLTYKELYLFLFSLNKRRIGERNAKIKAIDKIIEIYKSHHDNNEPNFEREIL